jgi:hypothetical protein
MLMWWMRAGLQPIALERGLETISIADAPSQVWLDTAAVMHPPFFSGSSVAIFERGVAAGGLVHGGPSHGTIAREASLVDGGCAAMALMREALHGFARGSTLRHHLGRE